MFLARTGDIVTGICICNSIFPYNPYPITGIIGVGNPQLFSGGITTAQGQLTLVNFICTSGPQTALIIAMSQNTSGGMSVARMADPVVGPCITAATITSATSTINSM